MSSARRGLHPTLAVCLAPLAPLLPLLPLLLGGCGQNRERTTPVASLQRLELVGARPIGDAPAPRAVVHIDVPPELPDDWQVHSSSFEIVHGRSPRQGEPWTGLALEGAKAGQLRIAGSFDPRTFNRAALTLRVQNKIDVGVRFFRGGAKVLDAPAVRIPGVRGSTTVVIDLPRTIEHEEPFDALAFYYRRLNADPVFVALDLLWTPLRQWLPDATSGPEPVALGDEFREALGLSSQDPLSAEVTPLAGTVLRFGYGRPTAVRYPVRSGGQRVSLEVLLEAGDTRVKRSFALPASGAAADRWGDGEIDLSTFAERTTRVTFALVGSDERESLCALATPFVAHPARGAQTVVLITSDTHRADHIGARGAGVPVRTPFLDGLAQRGVLFEDCFSATNITNPSHAAILTAVSPRDTGMVDNVTALAAPAATLAEAFQDAGFRTLAAVSTGHMRHTQSGLGQGFDRMHAPDGQADVDADITAGVLADWVADSEGLPLFVWLHVFDAHAPYKVPAELRFLYYDESRDPRDPGLPSLPPLARAKWDAEVRDLDFIRAQYMSEVTYLDARLADFASSPRFDEAVIAVTADHGESLGNHELYFMHQGLFPDTLAVPLILSWPDAPAGTRVSAPVRQLDLGRTLLDLAGLSDAPFPGQNLLRWTEEPERPREPRFAISSHGSSASVELDGWFLVLALQTHANPRRVKHQVELYALRSDPTCSEDLVDREPERAGKLRAILIDWLATARDSGLSRASAHQDTRMLEQLAALGYAESATTPAGATWYEPDPDDPWCRRFE